MLPLGRTTDQNSEIVVARNPQQDFDGRAPYYGAVAFLKSPGPRDSAPQMSQTAGRVQGVVRTVSISLEILSALAERSEGEAPISELRGQLARHASSPERLAQLMSEARANGRVHYGPRNASTSELFSKGLIDRPRPGVWRITPAGLAYLADVSPAQPLKHR